MRKLTVSLVAASCALLPAAALADDDAEPSGEAIVRAYNERFHWSIAPGFFIPLGGGSGGFAVVGIAEYGLRAGPTIVVPGLRLAGIFPSGGSVLIGMPTARWVFPIGGFAPFVGGGAGAGRVSPPDQAGFAWRAGGGFTFHFSVNVGLGAEVAYESIEGTGYRGLSLGPILALAL